MSVQTFFDSGLITQIIYLNIAPSQRLEQKQTDVGSKWSKALDSITAFPGLVRLYWGRRLEEPEKIQLHLGWPRPSVAYHALACKHLAAVECGNE